MLKALLKRAVALAAAKLPWELITAQVASYIIRLVAEHKEGVVDRVRRYVEKVTDQLAAISAAMDDNKIAPEEVAELVDAWSDGRPSPKNVETKVLN